MKTSYSIVFITIFLNVYCQAQTFDVQHQIIDLKPDWEHERLLGTTTIDLVLLKSTDEIKLDGRMLAIEAIRSDGELKFNYDPELESGNIQVQLGKRFNKGDQLSISLNYQTDWINETDPANIWGSLGEGVRFFTPSTTEPERQKQIWTVGEPVGNTLWYPGNHENTDHRTTELFFTIEKPLKVLSNGQLMDVKDNGNGTQTFHWKTEIPYASHLTSFVAGRYLPVTQQYNDIPITNYCYPHEADATAATVERLPDMMRYYSEITGVEYPYPSYSQIFVQEFAGWQGNMMTSTITENMVDDWVTHKDFRWLWDIVESEALASQWFGVNITPESWMDAWLTKGFSRHLSGLYNEYKNGEKEFLSYQLNPQVSTYLSDWNVGNIQSVVHEGFSDPTTFVRSNHPYMHGASVLYMLRKQLGDDIWFSILKNFTQTFTGRTVSTTDFKKVVEDISKQDMTWFFDQWIYGVGHPVFEVGKSWNAAKNELTLNVSQLQKLDTLETDFPTSKYFQGKMQIELGDLIEEIYIEPKAESSYVFKLSSNPTFVNFDFKSTWVKEERFEKSTDEWISQLNNSQDILAKIQALNKLGSIYGQTNTPQEDKHRINESIRKAILSPDAYWRLKMLALWQLQGVMISNGQLAMDSTTEIMLLEVIKKEESWVKSSAVWFLGMTQDPKFADLYINLFEDWSDRVTNAAAIALGKTKSPKAYDALIELQYKPSWKNQSLISTLNGLQWLNDPRGIDLALESLMKNEAKHWTLSTPIWDHRLAAGNTLNALGEVEKGYDFIYAQLKSAVGENDLNDVMYNALQIINLADPRGKEAFEFLKNQYNKDESILNAVLQLEVQFQNAIRK